MSLKIGKVYEYDGWLFVPVLLKWPVFTVMTLHVKSGSRMDDETPGNLTPVFENSMVGQSAREVA